MRITTIHVLKLADDDRRVLERVLGQPLNANQSVTISVESPTTRLSPTRPPFVSQLPAWCNVLEGLDESERENVASEMIGPVNFRN